MITNKPQDTDPIVTLGAGPLGEQQYIMTEVFSRFLDDLVAQFNQAPDDPEASTSHERAHQRLSTQDITAKVSLICQENAALKSEVRALTRSLGSLEQKINNLEQIAWR